MDVVSLCPLPATGFVYRSQAGTFAQTVVVKATYTLRPGEAVLAPAQEELNEEDNHWNDDPARSVYTPSDRAPYKPKADVMLVGHAFAPEGKTVRSLMVRLVVGELDKAIEVFCDRAFTRQGQLLEGSPFTKMPLRWERAAGGPGTGNPVGIRWDGPPDVYGRMVIPNLQPPGMHVSRRADTFPPICFGPIAENWPSRVQKLGRHTGMFSGKGRDVCLLPSDLDYGYFQGAPLDQQVSELRPNERIVLEHLHPEHARLITNLPGIRPRAIVDRATGEREEVQLAADTLWIDTDRGICALVWRGRLGLRHAQEAGRVSVWVDGMPVQAVGKKAGQEAPLKPDGGKWGEEAVGDGTITLVKAGEAKKTPALPFGSAQHAEAPPLAPLPPAVATRLGALANVPVDEASGTIVALVERPAKAPLPFGEPTRSGPNVMNQSFHPVLQEVVWTNEWDPMATRMGGFKPSEQRVEGILPFKTAEIQGQPQAPAFVPAIIAPMAEVSGLEGVRDADLAVSETGRVTTPVEIVPPPMIGSLGTATPALSKLPDTAHEEPSRQDIAVDNAQTEYEDEVVELTIEETATVAAELTEEQISRAQVLEAHKLNEHSWMINEARWNAALEEEQGRGRNTLRRAYDVAYVKRVERFRGKLTVGEYARIIVGMERGKVGEVLDGFAIHRKALMPIIRVWSRKVAQDMNVGRETTMAIGEAREA